jgi:hypothetical protein
MTLSIIDATTFNANTDISYKALHVNDKGGKSIGILNRANGQNLHLQTPLMLTWGLNKWTDEFSGRVSYDLVLQFPKDEYATQETTNFLNNIKAWETKLIQDAMNNSRPWFNKASMSEDVVDNLFTPLLKHPKDKETKELDLSRPPTFKVKIGCWDSVFDCELYNASRQSVFPPENTDGLDTADFHRVQEKTLTELISKGCQISTVIKCKGVWFANGSFGVTWLLVQAVVQPRPTFKGKCHIQLSASEQNTLQQAAVEMAQKETEHETAEETEVVDTDDDEEEEEVVESVTLQEATVDLAESVLDMQQEVQQEVHQEVTEEVEQEKPKKRRVVKKKKVATKPLL